MWYLGLLKLSMLKVVASLEGLLQELIHVARWAQDLAASQPWKIKVCLPVLLQVIRGNSIITIEALERIDTRVQM